MRLRRGFVKEANAYALEFRQELGINPVDPLSPFALADHLGIEIVRLSDWARSEPKLRYFLGRGKSEFSACTLFIGHSRFMVHNDSHVPVRQNSNISHELAHAILGHPPTPPLNEWGCRFHDKTVEEEAKRLGAVLLVPEQVVRWIFASQMDLQEAAGFYGVSTKLLTMQINRSGVKTMLERMRRRS